MTTPLKLLDFALGRERLLRSSDSLEVGQNLSLGGNLIINSDNESADQESSSILFHRGTETGASLVWDNSNDKFKFNFPVMLSGIQSGLEFEGSGVIRSGGSLLIKDNNLTSGVYLSDSSNTGLSSGFSSNSLIGSINQLKSEKLEAKDVSFNLLSTRDLVGSRADQIAVGNHTHPSTFIDMQVTKTLYVDINRTDSYVEDGSVIHPYKSLQNAISAADNGTGISVAPGLYPYVIVPANKSIALKGTSYGKESTVVEGLLLTNSTVSTSFLSEDISYIVSSDLIEQTVYVGYDWNVHFEKCDILHLGTKKALVINGEVDIFSGGKIYGTVDINTSSDAIFDDNITIDPNTSSISRINILGTSSRVFFRGAQCNSKIEKLSGHLSMALTSFNLGDTDGPLLVQTGGTTILNDIFISSLTLNYIYSNSGIFWSTDGVDTIIYIGTHNVRHPLTGVSFKTSTNSIVLNGGVITNLPYPVKASDSINDSTVYGSTLDVALDNLKMKVTYYTITDIDENNGYCIISPASSGPTGVKENVEITVLGGPQMYRGKDFTVSNSDDNSKLIIIWKTSGSVPPEFSYFIYPSDGLVGLFLKDDVISIQYQ